jgi:hypothetical protein
VRTEGGAARATIKHYYRARLFDRGLWGKILRGRFDYAAALSSAWGLARSALRPARHPAAAPAAALPERMRDGLARFDGRILFMLCGADLTAQEFGDVADGDTLWRRLMAERRVTRFLLPGADHTCSQRAWHEQVVGWTCEWMHDWTREA